METVRGILETKAGGIISVDPDATLEAALKVMSEHNIGAVLVLDKQERLVGVFSERDFVRNILGKGHKVETTKVKEIMTSKVLSVLPDTSISDCMNLMTENRIRHLPVIANGKVMGVISIGDVVKTLIKAEEAIISEQALEIGQLNNFITGSP